MVGFGGFSSFGPAMAAKARGIPVFIHEANRAVGKAVRFLAKRSKASLFARRYASGRYFT